MYYLSFFNAFFSGCKLSTLAKDSDWFDNSQPVYKSLLAKFLCPEPTESCYYRSCKKCPKISTVIDEMNELFENNDKDKIHYKKWTSTNHCTLVEVTCSSEIFLQSLSEQIGKILKHDFDAKSQSRYYSNLKTQLKSGEFLVTLDFAENYAFIVQEAAQAFHWNNDQATLFPMVVYYMENDESKHCSFVGISDCRHHDTVAVYLFQEELIKYLRQKFQNVSKIYYFTDGAPQQFKNKSAFINLCYHINDFGLKAEWHFFATAHGKGPCDGLAGTIKRHAARASLQMGTTNEILTPLALYDWARQSFKNIDFTFISNEKYEVHAVQLKSRFANAVAVKKTQSMHCIIPDDENHGFATVRDVSQSTVTRKVQIIKVRSLP